MKRQAPVARPPKVAKGSSDGADPRSQAEKDAQQEGGEIASIDVEGLKIAAEHKMELAERARTQAEKFEAAARELGCDPDEDRFKDVLRKLAKPKS